MLTFRFSGTEGMMTESEVLTSGMVGKRIALEFSEDWDKLVKTLVFSNGVTTVSRLLEGETGEIPAVILQKPLKKLTVGVYGVSTDGKLVIPTIRALGPVIQPGVELAWDPDPDPELPVWAQLQAQLGDLAQLDTTEKENLVWAINELAARECPPGEPGADGVTFKPWITSDGLLKWTNDGGLVNPLPTNIKGPKGEDGVTPVRGVDYWTDADKAEIKAYVEDALLGGAW